VNKGTIDGDVSRDDREVLPKACFICWFEDVIELGLDGCINIVYTHSTQRNGWKICAIAPQGDRMLEKETQSLGT
jgi:hypothetical protein